MRIRSTLASIVLMLPVFAVPLLTTFALGEEPDPLSFNRDVRPILSDNCFGCHGPAAKDVKAGLQLDSFESATALLGKGKDRQALVPGDRKASELWKRITSMDPDEKMPPPDSNHRLTPGQIEVLGQWIDQGAEYEGHWSFQVLKAAPGSSIDSLIRARLDGTGLRPALPADRATLLRRITQDLTGLPPTSGGTRRFPWGSQTGCLRTGGRSASPIASRRRTPRCRLARRGSLCGHKRLLDR